jgi:hypothetical protein
MRLNVYRSRRLAAACAVICALLSGVCHAANFSADMSMKQGKATMTAKLYVSGSNWRVERGSQGSQRLAIGRGDKHMVYVVNPAAKQYFEMPGIPDQWRASYWTTSFSKGMNRKSLGKQTVNGVSCDKYVYTPKPSKSKQAPVTVTQWVAKDLDLPVKTDVKTPDGVQTTEFTNIKRQTPPASLFEIPKGCKKVATPTAPPPGTKPTPSPKHK